MPICLPSKATQLCENPGMCTSSCLNRLKKSCQGPSAISIDYVNPFLRVYWVVSAHVSHSIKALFDNMSAFQGHTAFLNKSFTNTLFDLFQTAQSFWILASDNTGVKQIHCLNCSKLHNHCGIVFCVVRSKPQ